MRLAILPLALPFAAAVALPAAAQPVDRAAVNRIVDEAMNHSQVKDLAQHLTDRIGSRLPNSPQAREAEAWTQRQFRAWGLGNVRTEGFDFGRGWSYRTAGVRMVSPRPLDLVAIPVAWTPGTTGPVRAGIVLAPLAAPADFDAWRGKLKGRIVLISNPDDTLYALKPGAEARLSEAGLKALDIYRPPHHGGPTVGDWFASYQALNAKIDAFLAAEGALGWVRMSKRPGQVVGEGYFHKVGETPRLPGVEMAAVDYRRLARLARASEPVAMEIESEVSFHDEDANAYNVFAEIPGRDPSAGYVMAGIHLDSWVAGDGAGDGAGNVAVVMEAARILARLGVKPRRTIRFALWGGEMQGLYGVQAYVERHLADRGDPANTDRTKRDYGRWENLYPVRPRAGYRQLAAYFNLDNGPGRIRGIYAEGNAEVAPIFRTWLEPFAAMGAGTVAVQRRIETSHQYLQDIGLPGFQFIQDPIDPGHQIFQTRADTLDVLDQDDLRINAAIVASFLLFAADRDQPLPAMPLPTAPGATR